MSDDISPSPYIEYDRLLGGLLIEGFDEKSCRSRYQFARYHKSPSIPSPYLIERLRKRSVAEKVWSRNQSIQGSIKAAKVWSEHQYDRLQLSDTDYPCWLGESDA
jgi:hypothetical protein